MLALTKLLWRLVFPTNAHKFCYRHVHWRIIHVLGKSSLGGNPCHGGLNHPKFLLHDSFQITSARQWRGFKMYEM